jgi:hypothetical protein
MHFRAIMALLHRVVWYRILVLSMELMDKLLAVDMLHAMLVLVKLKKFGGR